MFGSCQRSRFESTDRVSWVRRRACASDDKVRMLLPKPGGEPTGVTQT